MRVSWGHALLGGTLVAGLALLPAGPAVAAPPSNDDFDDAVELTAVPFQVTADTIGATRAPDDPFCVGDDESTVWYAVRLDTTTELVIDTFGSDFDTTLSAWTGERGSLEQVACNDDAQDLQSRILFTAEAGVTYHLMVGSFPTTPGGSLVLTGQELPPPPTNDDFDDAVELTAVPFQVTADTIGATRAPDDPFCVGDDESTVWYAVRLDTTTELVIDTFGSDFDTTLSAWTGERGSLEQVACNDDAQDLQSRILFTAEAGVTYHLMVGSFPTTPGGSLVLTGQEAPPPLQLAVTLDPTGTVSDGVAIVTGTVGCSRPVTVEVVGTLRQQIRNRVTVGSFRVVVDCTSSDDWQATVLGETGTYRRGTATGVAATQVDDPVRGETVRARASGPVRLR